jgi:hypothetical protein
LETQVKYCIFEVQNSSHSPSRVKKNTKQYGRNLFYSKDRQNNVKYVGFDNFLREK